MLLMMQRRYTMLEEYRDFYTNWANNINGWDKLSKNELCFKYIENENDAYLRDSYLAAIVSKYWGLIKQYYDQSPGVCEPEDVYGWLIDSILYALKNRRWEDKDSSIYMDKNGPDKVINRQMKCRRATFYQSINKLKRCENFGTQSLDEWVESVGDDIPVKEQFTDEHTGHIEEFIRKKFNDKEYESAYIIDIIAFDNVYNAIDKTTNKFSERLLVDELEHIDDDYLIRFAVRYGFPCEEENNCRDVMYSKKYLHLTRNEWHNRIKRTLSYFRHDDFFRSMRYN